jgi:L-cystine transport system substrate-binding protein
MMKKRIVFAAAAALVLAFVLVCTGCGKSGAANGAAGGGDAGRSAGSAVKTQKIKVGTVTTYVPFAYIDEDGKLQGYDIEVLRAVDELLPEYEFEFEGVEFTTLFPSLKDGHFDMVTCQLERNPERESQYIFTEEVYFDFVAYFVVLEENNYITDIESMHGKIVGSAASSNQYTFLASYLAEHPGAFEIKALAGASSDADIYMNLSSKAWDAALLTKFDVIRIMENYPDISLKVSKKDGEEYIVTHSPTYFMLSQSNTALRDAVDGALKTLKANGAVNALQERLLGQLFFDFTK